MKTISIWSTFGVGWESFKKRPWYLLGLTIATLALFIASTSNALVTALAYILYGGYLGLMLQHYRGAHIRFDDLFTVTDFRFVSFAFLAVIKGFFIIIGFLAFIVPGIYLSVRWMYAELLVVDKGMKPLEALKASSTMTEGTRGKLFLFMLAAFITTVLGLLALIIGAFVMMVVWLFALISLYENAKGKLADEATPATEAPVVQ